MDGRAGVEKRSSEGAEIGGLYEREEEEEEGEDDNDDDDDDDDDDDGEEEDGFEMKRE